MSGLEPTLLMAIGGTLLSGAATYAEHRQTRKAISLQREQEEQQMLVNQRMAQGKTLTTLGLIGINPESASVSSFLQAQKTSALEAMDYFGGQTRIAKKRAFYARLEDIFGTASKFVF